MGDLITPIAMGLATIVAGYLAYRGTKGTDATDRLSKAASLYGEYAEKMEKRVSHLEEEQEKLSIRLSISEEEAKRYKMESRAYKKAIVEVIQWLTELINWETNGKLPPEPKITITVILSHLTEVLSRNQQGDSSQKEA